MKEICLFRAKLGEVDRCTSVSKRFVFWKLTCYKNLKLYIWTGSDFKSCTVHSNICFNNETKMFLHKHLSFSIPDYCLKKSNLEQVLVLFFKFLNWHKFNICMKTTITIVLSCFHGTVRCSIVLSNQRQRLLGEGKGRTTSLLPSLACLLSFDLLPKCHREWMGRKDIFSTHPEMCRTVSPFWFCFQFIFYMRTNIDRYMCNQYVLNLNNVNVMQ